MRKLEARFAPRCALAGHALSSGRPVLRPRECPLVSFTKTGRAVSPCRLRSAGVDCPAALAHKGRSTLQHSAPRFEPPVKPVERHPACYEAHGSYGEPSPSAADGQGGAGARCRLSCSPSLRSTLHPRSAPPCSRLNPPAKATSTPKPPRRTPSPRLARPHSSPRHPRRASLWASRCPPLASATAPLTRATATATRTTTRTRRTRRPTRSARERPRDTLARPRRAG